MAIYIAIDGGTTNTRISIVKDRQVIDILKFNVGAKIGMNNKHILENTIKNGITEILEKNNIEEKNVSRILVSGMLTSEFGLMNLEHIVIPAGIEELHDSMVEDTLKDISEIPMVFIRGVKTQCDSISDADMMRGEETELMGMAEDDAENVVYILPGSHSKIIKTDRCGKITNFATMLTGEMIAAISEETILKDAVDLDVSEISDEYMFEGFDYCRENGFNKSLFKIRVLKNIFGKDKIEVYSFFMGVMLCDEIKEIIKLNPERIVIGGRKQIKEATYKILARISKCKIECVKEEKVSVANSLGMVKIYEYNQ